MPGDRPFSMTLRIAHAMHAATTPVRVVLDTNVCLDLFVFRDPRVAALEAALRTGAIAAVTRADCRGEWQRVLRYPQFRLDDEGWASACAAFDALIPCAAAAPPADPDPALPRCRDPDDQKFLELAWETGARALITKDKALLALRRRLGRLGLFEVLPPEAWTAARATA